MTTPMMQQYREAKERAPRHAPAVPQGDFYELFDEDAELVSRVLGLDADQPRQARSRWPASRTMPSNTTSASCCSAGHRVAVCDQVEDAGPGQGRSSAARSRASSRPAPSPKTSCSTRAQPTTSSPLAPSAAARRRPGLGRAVDRRCSRPPTCRRDRAGRRAGPARAAECLCRRDGRDGRVGRCCTARSAAGADRHRPARLDVRPGHRPRGAVRRTSASARWPASASTTTSRASPPPGRCCSTCRRRSRPSLRPPPPAAALPAGPVPARSTRSPAAAWS